MPRDEWVLYAVKRPIQCGKKNVYQGGLTDIAIRRQKSDGNAVHLVKNLDHVDLGYRVSGLSERSFGGIKNDDYGYDHKLGVTVITSTVILIFRVERGSKLSESARSNDHGRP